MIYLSNSFTRDIHYGYCLRNAKFVSFIYDGYLIPGTFIYPDEIENNYLVFTDYFNFIKDVDKSYFPKYLIEFIENCKKNNEDIYIEKNELKCNECKIFEKYHKRRGVIYSGE